jgi:lipoyl(octanoyl) transferase
LGRPGSARRHVHETPSVVRGGCSCERLCTLRLDVTIAAIDNLVADLHVHGAVVRRLGRTDYEACWRAMQSFTDARSERTSDEIWLTEHAPIYTFGLAGRREHLLRDNGIAAIGVDRGGQVTYHGPGQLVAYLLFDLRRSKLGVRSMVRRIEAAVIEFLASLRVDAYGREGAPGVYVERSAVEAKIAALGLKVRNGCTYHGLALNVAMDLAPFADIDPCGYPGLAVTQLADLGIAMSVQEAGEALAPMLASHLAAPAR